MKYQDNLNILYNYCLVLSRPPEMKLLQVLVKSHERPKFSRKVLFHMKVRVCLKYFLNYCKYRISA